MILPIFAYGQRALKKKAKDIDLADPAIPELIENMWETMYNAQGVGLAAPQIGQAIRLFIVDTVQTQKEGEEDKGLKKVFINAKMVEEWGEEWSYEEGCLSIPNLRGDVVRYSHTAISYQDIEGNEYEEEYDGINARVIQHEYDHIEGKLFTELLKPLKRKLIKRKLENIKKGIVDVDYRMKFV